MLVVMGPVLQVSVARLYAGALLPGLLLAGLYVIYTMVRVWRDPKLGPPLSGGRARRSSKGYVAREFFLGLIPPAALIIATLGSIITGWATPTEGAAIGCVGALVVTAAHGKLSWAMLKDATFRTVQTSSMVMVLLVASTFMGSVFSALGTPTFIAKAMLAWDIPPGLADHRHPGALLRPRLAARMGADRRHHRSDLPADPDRDEGRHGVVQHPARGHAADLLAVAAGGALGLLPQGRHARVGASRDIYKGMLPFMGLQWLAVLILYFFPQIILVLPNMMFGTR